MPTAADWANVGFLGTGMAVIDGTGVGPFVLLRHLDGEVHLTYSVPFEKFELPNALLDPDVRDQIRALVDQAMTQWKAAQK